MNGTRCPPHFRNAAEVASLISRVDNLTEAWLVNIGARLPQGAAQWDGDLVWDIVHQRRDSRPRVVAFEGDEGSFRVLQHSRLARNPSVQLVNEYVSSHTIAAVLASRGVPRHFPLLKIDIDSIDLPVARAILSGGFKPTVIVVEFNQWTPLPVEFAALEPRRHERLNASYGMGFRGRNRVWPCMGASLASWYRLASEFGYQLLQIEQPPTSANALLLRADLARAHFSGWSADHWCHFVVFPQHWSLAYRLIPDSEYSRYPSRSQRVLRTRLWSAHLVSNASIKTSNPYDWVPAPEGSFDYGWVTERIESQCTKVQTPYDLRIEGACCPKAASGSPFCRQSCRDQHIQPLKS